MRIWTRLVAIILAVVLVATTFVPIGFSLTDGNLLSISMRQVGADGSSWLSDWAYRIKLTTNSSLIDTADLSHFPLTAFLNGDNGDTAKVFEEVGDNKLKIAIADDAATPVEYYVEIEQWDSAGKVGVLHFGKSGETLPSAADKDYYLYYDAAHADNADFVGVQGSTPGKAVWDTSFSSGGVWHMNSATNTQVETDSTSNDVDGTKKANDEPSDVAGQIGRAKQYDGTDDFIGIGNDVYDADTQGTIEIYLKRTETNRYDPVFNACVAGLNNMLHFRILDNAYGNVIAIQAFKDSTGAFHDYVYGSTAIGTADYYHIAVTSTGSAWKLYVNGAAESLTILLGTNSGKWFASLPAATHVYHFGRLHAGAGNTYAKAIMDEIRYSSGVERTAGWIKATYHSLNDSLLTYGSEESYTMAITSTPDSYDFGTLEVNTTGATGLTHFTITNTGNVAVDITIQGTDLTGGDDTWTLSNTAEAAANTYGLKVGLEGGDYTVIVKKSATYNVLKSNLAVDATQKWGLKIWMPTSVTDYDGQTMTGTVTLVASATS